MKTILFNDTCAAWTSIPDLNIKFLHLQRDYLNDLLTVRGYVYLNEIYQTLGVTWNPKNENVCYMSDDGPIEMEFESLGEGNYLVKFN